VIDPVARRVLDTRAVGGSPAHVAMDAVSGVATVPDQSGWVDIER